MDKVRSTLKQLVRDWSEEVSGHRFYESSSLHRSHENIGKGRKRGKLSAHERSLVGSLLRYTSGGKVSSVLVTYPAPSRAKFRHNFRVLVPGAGLGRLAYDVAKLGKVSNRAFPSIEPTPSGFSCQGNEFSHYMLLSSFFVLNRCAKIASTSPSPILIP
jgi:carnosine N-methyltransferase